MKDLNHVIEIGRLVKDAEVHKFDENNGVMQFTIAVNTSSKKDGQFVDVANFFNCRSYGSNTYLDKMSAMMIKGTQVAVDGYLKQDHWEKDGKKNSAVLIIAEQLQLCGGKKTGSSDGFPEDIPYEDAGQQKDIPF